MNPSTCIERGVVKMLYGVEWTLKHEAKKISSNYSPGREPSETH